MHQQPGYMINSNPLFNFPAMLLQSLEREREAEESPPPSPDLQHYDELEASFTASLSDLSPLSSPEPSPESHCSSSIHPAALSSALEDAQLKRKKRLQGNKRAARKRKRNQDAEDPLSHHEGRPAARAKHFDEARTVQLDAETEKLPATSTGYTATNNHSKTRTQYALDELAGPNSPLAFQLIEWDGRETVRLVDSSGRVFMVLAGQPDDADWGAVNEEATAAIERCRPLCRISRKHRVHRRGSYLALSCGVSHGGGQTNPKNVFNTKRHRKIVQELSSKKAFKRLAGFASSAMATAAPKLHQYYCSMIDRLHASDPSLKRGFPSGVFSTFTYNLGPRTICFRHRDFANLSFGWCAVSALGSFCHKKGGHLILWDLKAVVEFPAGSTILLPSAVLEHSNALIQEGECRFSFTQYTAGALFRWADSNLQPRASYLSSLGADELAKVKEYDNARWHFGLSLLPVVDLQNVPI